MTSEGNNTGPSGVLTVRALSAVISGTGVEAPLEALDAMLCDQAENAETLCELAKTESCKGS